MMDTRSYYEGSYDSRVASREGGEGYESVDHHTSYSDQQDSSRNNSDNSYDFHHNQYHQQGPMSQDSYTSSSNTDDRGLPPLSSRGELETSRYYDSSISVSNQSSSQQPQAYHHTHDSASASGDYQHNQHQDDQQTNANSEMDNLTMYNPDTDPHLPPIEKRAFDKTSKGEYHGDDLTSILIPIRPKVYLWVFCAALNSCNIGYDIGISSDAAQLMQDSMDLSDSQVELFMASLNIFSMIGALCAQFVSDSLGRRRALQVSASIFISGILIISTATNFYALVFGRVFLGIGVGFGMAIDPMYIAEISPAAHRGQLVTWSEIAMNVGLVFGFVSKPIFSSLPDEEAWRYMYGFGAFIPTLLLILVCFIMPESPRWLVSKGFDEEAMIVLESVYPEGYHVELIVKDIGDMIRREVDAERAIGWDVILFPTPAFRRMLFVGLGTAIAQQAVGIEAIQYFLIFIIDDIGIQSEAGQSAILIFITLVKLVFIFVPAFLFDIRGRRSLIFISLVGMSLSMLVLSMTFVGENVNIGFSIFLVTLYLIFYSIGMGPGCWLIPSELFATTIRSKAMSIATFLNRVTATIMTSTFLSVASEMSWAGFFFLLAFVCIFVAGFFFIYLPESKGRPLEDMSLYFAEITGDRTILDVEEDLKKQTNEQDQHDLMTAFEMESRVLDAESFVEASGTMA